MHKYFFFTVDIYYPVIQLSVFKIYCLSKV